MIKIAKVSGPLLGLALASFLVLGTRPAAAGEEQPVVVELFTSQGCSSCPPADRFLGELAKRDDVVALSVHVDYWDYIGWKDPFASPANTKRQHRYAQKLGLRYVYTPQMVIQGTDHATGSDRRAVLAKIAEARKLDRLPVTIARSGDGVRVTVPGAHTTDKAAVWLALFDRQHETAIRRGENGGRTLKYHNVVRNMVRIGTWTGLPLDIPTGSADMSAEGRDGCAVIVQSLSTGRILGAARLDLTGS